MTEVLENIRGKFEQDLRFLRGWMRSPSGVGSVTPTGRAVAGTMASLIPNDSNLPVLELGPGTGVITEALLERGIKPEKIVSIEYSEDFYRYLKKKFPGVNFLHGDGFSAASLLSDTPWRQFCGVIGAIPLLNFPRKTRADLIANCLDLVEPGGAFVQLSYGLRAPSPSVPGKISIEATDWIVKNVPPAKVYAYRLISKPCQTS